MPLGARAHLLATVACVAKRIADVKCRIHADTASGRGTFLTPAGHSASCYR